MMTDNEIYRDWRGAKSPDKQIRILSDMNCKSRAEIISILAAQRKEGDPPLPNGKSKKPTEAQIAEIREDYKSGMSMDACARKWGKSKATIYRCVKDITRPRGGNEKEDKPMIMADEMPAAEREKLTGRIMEELSAKADLYDRALELARYLRKLTAEDFRITMTNEEGLYCLTVDGENGASADFTWR